PVMVFIERPGTSKVMSAMPSLSTSILKFSILPILLGLRWPVLPWSLLRSGYTERCAEAGADSDAEPHPQTEVMRNDTERRAKSDAEGDAHRKNHGIHQFTRSITVAVPWPPPMQSVTIARALFERSSSSTMVPRIIAPVAPSGWPMAMAPPLTLT